MESVLLVPFAELAPLVEAAPFVRTIEALVERFPDWPPDEGAFEGIVPHLTAAQGEPSTLDAAETDLAPRLPWRAPARETALLQEVRPGRWVRQAAFVPEA